MGSASFFPDAEPSLFCPTWWLSDGDQQFRISPLQPFITAVLPAQPTIMGLATPGSTPTAKKRRMPLSLSKKLEIMKKKDDGATFSTAAHALNLAPSTVYTSQRHRES